MLIPELYQDFVNENCIENLNTFFFPGIRVLIAGDRLSDFEIGAIKLAVALISQEIGWRYDRAFSTVTANKITQLSEKELCELKSDEFRKILFRNNCSSNISEIVTQQWVENLKYLSNLVKKYAIIGYSSNVVGQVLPILLQCVDANEEATDCLISMMNELDTHSKSNDRIMIALYRALSKERFDNHSKLQVLMECVWGSGKIPTAMIEICKEVVRFYELFANDISSRFDRKALSDRIQEADRSEQLFYSRYLHGTIDNQDEILWVSKVYFESNKVVDTLSQWLNIAQANDSKVTYSRRLICMNQFVHLFSCLAAKLDTEPRIFVQGCNDLLSINCEDRNDNYHEIFGVYSNKQKKQLFSLQNRIESEMKKLPGYGSVIMFERIKMEKNDKNQKLKEYVDSRFRLLEQKMEQTRKSQLYYETVRNYILQYAADDDSFSKLIMKMLVTNPQLTRNFCDDIYAICDDDSVPKEVRQNLISIGAILEKAISHPEKYTAMLSKEHLLDALDYVTDMIPGKSMVQCLVSLSRAIGCKIDVVNYE